MVIWDTQCVHQVLSINITFIMYYNLSQIWIKSWFLFTSVVNTEDRTTWTLKCNLHAAFSPWWGSAQQPPRCRYLAEVTEGLGWHKAHRHPPSWRVPLQVKGSTASVLVVSSGSSSGAAALHRRRVRTASCREAGRSEPQQWGRTLRPSVKA